jgi:hypothetical protein
MASMNQAPAADIRASMPCTTAWVEKARAKLGAKYVNGVLRRALGGERGCFYAVEGGHFLGAPFDWEPKGAMLISMTVLTGEPFIAALREPDGVVIGKAGGSAA